MTFRIVVVSYTQCMPCVKMGKPVKCVISKKHLTMKELSANAEIWYIGRSYMYV